MNDDTLDIIEEQIKLLKIESATRPITLDETTKLEKLKKLRMAILGQPTDITQNNVLSLDGVETADLVKKLKELKKLTIVN